MNEREEWRKVKVRAIDEDCWEIEGSDERSIATCYSEEDADAILREHESEVRWNNVEKVLAEREARIAELEAVLKAVEWSNHSEAVAEESHCSFCLNWKSEGHEESCIVHKALQ